MLSTSVDFPGLSKLRQMGQRMAQMRRGGMQGNPSNPAGGMMGGIPEFNPSLNAPQNVPGATFMGGGEAGQDEEALMGASTGETIAPGATPQAPELMPRPIAPPATSSLRDVRPRGLGSYRQAGMSRSRGMI
jgi:hypothetical protein